MTSQEYKEIFADCALIVLVLLLTLPMLCGKGREPKTELKRDTIYVYDTIRIVEPIPVKDEVVRYIEVRLPNADSGLPNELPNDSARLINKASKTERDDSVAVIAPISEKVYEDSLYRAVVRGYKPELVSLDICNTTKYYPVVEKVKVKPKITISAGVYGGFGSKGADYGLGVMVGVPIWSW